MILSSWIGHDEFSDMTVINLVFAQSFGFVFYLMIILQEISIEKMHELIENGSLINFLEML